jgi:beta-lactamase superfamily II metal-dependent hydrolase
MPGVDLRRDTLSVHILRVGDGDSMIIELPEKGGERGHIMVDSYLQDKTKRYVRDLGVQVFRLVVATHPHRDHILAMENVLRDFNGPVEQFWDSGFRHTSGGWDSLIKYILDDRPETIFMRPTSGLSTIIDDVEITVLAPSINLRNRYDTFGININNSSIVLKLTYADRTIILGADAQFESWAKITEEFPHFEETKNPFQHIQVDKDFLPLECRFLKVSHHGSKHGTMLEALEKLKYWNRGDLTAVISCGDPSGHEFPDDLATLALDDIGAKILETSKGSVVLTIESDGTVDSHQYQDTRAGHPGPPNRI